jgi:hypothetical protein
MTTVSDVVHAWLRGEQEFPGDSYILWAVGEHMQEYVRQRHYGMDILASAELDNVARIIEKLRSHFG